MFALLSRLLNRKSSPSSRHARLGVESLEGRVVPAFVLGNMATIDASGILVISSTDAHDQVSVQSLNGVYSVYGRTVLDDGTEIAWRTSRFNASDVTGKTVFFNGGLGNDAFTNLTSTLRTIAIGGDGDDRLTGSGNIDSLDGGNGFDILIGNGGADFLSGGLGNDTLRGDAGNDILQGGDGDDTLLGGDGDDTLSGDAGNDILRGELGNDTLFGLAGNDQLWGSDGNDILSGGDGNDFLSGDWGNDSLHGGLGFDQLYGGGDNDFLDGGADGIADYLNGGAGADRFKGEWVIDSPFYLHYKNLDAPADFNLTQGDFVDSPYMVVIS